MSLDFALGKTCSFPGSETVLPGGLQNVPIVSFGYHILLVLEFLVPAEPRYLACREQTLERLDPESFRKSVQLPDVFQRIAPLLGQADTFVQRFHEAVQLYKDKRNTFIRYFSRVFFPESVFGYVTACPFRSDHLENPLPSEDADEVNRFYVVVTAPARSRIVNLRLPYVFIVIPSGECRLKTKDLHGSPGRFFRFPWSE